MIINKFIYYFFLSLLFSCGLIQNQNSATDSVESVKNPIIEKKDKPFLKMRKTPCYGKCPYFEVNFYENGFVTYEGLKFVDKIGIYNAQINKKEVAIIQDFIRLSDFFSFDELYDARVSDLPSVIIEVNYNGNFHKVKARYKAPKKFKELVKFIDNFLLDIDGWNKN